MTLNSLSPIDGRYQSKTACLSPYFSEYALIYYRLVVELRWLQCLAANPSIPELEPFDAESTAYLEMLLTDFDEAAAAKVKAHEAILNHDVKAVEYYLRDQLATHPKLKVALPFIHFACTSEDINNVAYALMQKAALQECLIPELEQLAGNIAEIARRYAELPMLARTHGQPASPSTLGKELINFAARLKRPLQQLRELPVFAKFNGAVGNYNAHHFAYPELNWPELTAEFIKGLGLSFTPYSTQIEPHDGIAELAHLCIRINSVLLDYSKDIWTYISLGYFKQRAKAFEVGSSTMPHKVNPIDFENAEGNLGLANALFEHFATKLTQSRLQRDLSDSTVLRNLGVAFAYMLIALQSLQKGNAKLEINPPRLQADLEQNWEVLAEAIQTLMRRHQVPEAYEQLKALTRGTSMEQQKLQQFIEGLAIAEPSKARLLALRPETYLGLAAFLVHDFQ